MTFIEKIYDRAKKAKKKILLPEGEELRILDAAGKILKLGICEVSLIGNPSRILKIAKDSAIDLKNAGIIDPEKYKNLDKYADLYCEVRKHKNVKKQDALKIVLENPVFYSALAVRAGDFDGFVAGAATTTRDVARAAIHCIGPAKDTPTVSSSSILVLPDKTLGSDGIFIYADAGIIPDPTAEQLADIAIASANMAEFVLDDQPRIAMLSYSTKGSGGSGKSVAKVQEATKLVMKRRPDLLIDGEVQIDCAVVPDVAARKYPDSKIKGRANVFIFPNLDAGNIAYKLTERLAKAHAIGPVIQGIRMPASDLSRGCNSQDIVDTVAITVLRAQST